MPMHMRMSSCISLRQRCFSGRCLRHAHRLCLPDDLLLLLDLCRKLVAFAPGCRVPHARLVKLSLRARLASSAAEIICSGLRSVRSAAVASAWAFSDALAAHAALADDRGDSGEPV